MQVQELSFSFKGIVDPIGIFGIEYVSPLIDATIHRVNIKK